MPLQAQWQNEQDQSAMEQQLQPQPSGPPNAGEQTVKTTQYGWATDNPSDYNTTTLKVGNHDNPLTPHSAALTDSEAAKLHAQPGDVLQVGGQKYYYADRAPESDDRVDLYQPQGMDKTIPDYQGVQDLGGGSPTLKGNALAQAGEANVLGKTAQPMMAQNKPATSSNSGWMGGTQNQAAFLQFLSQLNQGLR